MADHIACCDESGQRNYGNKTDPFFVIAGVVVPAADGPHLEDEIRGLKRLHWGNPDVEIKSNWIRRAEKRAERYTVPYGIQPSQIDALVRDLYVWLERSPIKVLAAVVDKPLMVNKYKKPHYPGTVCYTLFLHQFQALLETCTGSGSVVFDDPAGKSPGGLFWRDLLPRLHRRLQKHGCPYTTARFPNIGAVSLADSASNCFIQLADLIAYNTFRQFREHGPAWEDPDVWALPMYDHFKHIVDLFYLGPDRRLDGFGLVKFPQRRRVPRRLALAS